MASLESVQAGLEALVASMDDLDPDTRGKIPDRSVSAYFTDLDAAYAGRLESGSLVDVAPLDPARRKEAHLRLAMDSDTFLSIVEGRLDFAHAWSHGKVKVDARIRDIWELRKFL
ncbi:MAG: sterol-binding protein [Candidatus Nanopelagicales bacterium]